MSPPQAVIIAGPNGSGKSTAAARLLPPETTFVNADLIAQEIAGRPGLPGDINAGRVLLARVARLESSGEDFAFETTLATLMLRKRIGVWRELGYAVNLVFFTLPSPDLAVERVAQRVRDGGHHVPDDTVRRRFESGHRTFFRDYSPAVDVWRMYDNSTLEPRLVAKGGRGRETRVTLPERWTELENRYR